MPVARLLELTVTTDPSPEHASAALMLKLLTSGKALVVNEELLALAAVVQLLVAVKAIAMVFTTLELPAVLKELVVKVPLPLLIVKLAVVELTVLVPLTL